MNGWQLQAMWEDESARIWEEMNAEPEQCDNWFPAISKLEEAKQLINEAVDKLAQAADWTAGTDAENRIASLLNDLDTLGDYIGYQAEDMKKGGNRAWQLQGVTTLNR